MIKDPLNLKINKNELLIDISVDELLNSLSLEEKVGQMLMFAFHGVEFNEQLKTQIDEFHLGGVIHFARNIVNPDQVLKLNKDILEYSKYPMFIGVDQEGGIVQRITKGTTPFPGAMALAAANQDIRLLHRYVGEDLRQMNFNMVFAPVADVNNNPFNPVINSRSYSDDPMIVSNYVCEAFLGFQDALMLPTVKHFPGHGDTSVDSHVSMPSVNKSKSEIESMELVPFKEAIKAGIDGVMVAHIVYPAYDDLYPSTLSKTIVTDILRQKLGFKGLVVTDSLTMGAINNNYTKKEIVTLAANAGIDIMIFCGRADINEQREIYQGFIESVKEGNISLEIIDKAVRRILEYKKKYCVQEKNEKYIYPNKEKLLLGNKLSLASITKVDLYGKDNNQKNNTIINKEDKILVIFPKIKLFSLVDNNVNDYTTLGSCLKKQGVDVEEVIISSEDYSLSKIKEMTDKFDKIFMATYNVCKDDYQTKVFNCLPKDKVTVVAMRSPYDNYYLEELGSYICIYEASDLALNNLSLCLVGKEKFMGKLPVKLKDFK